MLQQGDVLFTQVSEVPAGAVARQGRVLVEGEHTGHNHALVCDCDVREYNGTLYVTVGAPTDVVHQEHGTITLAPGTWQVGRVREYDHFAEEAREVID